MAKIHVRTIVKRMTSGKEGWETSLRDRSFKYECYFEFSCVPRLLRYQRVGRTTRVAYIRACIAGKLRCAAYVYCTYTQSGGCMKGHQQSPGSMVVLRKHPKVLSPLQEETGGGFEP